MAFGEDADVLVDAALFERIPEPKDEREREEADGGEEGRDVIDAGLDAVGDGCALDLLVANDGEHKTRDACGGGLSELASEGIERVDRAVLADAETDLGVVDNVGYQSPGDHCEDAEAEPGEEVKGNVDPDVFGANDEEKKRDGGGEHI